MVSYQNEDYETMGNVISKYKHNNWLNTYRHIFFLDSENELLSDVEFESLVEDVVTNEFYAHRFRIKE